MGRSESDLTTKGMYIEVSLLPSIVCSSAFLVFFCFLKFLFLKKKKILISHGEVSPVPDCPLQRRPIVKMEVQKLTEGLWVGGFIEG